MNLTKSPPGTQRSAVHIGKVKFYLEHIVKTDMSTCLNIAIDRPLALCALYDKYLTY